MALDKEKAQDVIDDFVITNDVELNEISTQNPALFDATLNALNFLSARFGTGQKMQIVQKPKVVESNLPFKIGDKFKVPEEKTFANTYTISEIDTNNDSVKISWFSTQDQIDKSYYESLKRAIDFFNIGKWVKEEIDLQVGSILFDVNDEELLVVTDVTSNKQVRLETNEGKRKFLFDKDVWVSKIKSGEFIKPNFKIGDTFVNKGGDKFQILELNVLNKSKVNITKVTPSSTFIEVENWNDVDIFIKDGIWVKEQANEIKVGMLLKDNSNRGRIFKVLKINEARDWVVLELENTSIEDVEKLSGVKEGIKIGRWEVVKTQNQQNFIGTKFKAKTNNITLYTIIDYDPQFKKYKVGYLNDNGKQEDTGFAYSTKEVEDAFAKGTWIKEQATNIPQFEIGDAFVTEINGKVERVEIKSINENDGSVSVFWVGDAMPGILSITDVNDYITSGTWRKIQTLSQPAKTTVLQKMQILFDVNEETLYEIIDIGSTTIELKSGSGTTIFRNKNSLPKIIPSSYLLANFVIGDIFTNDAADIISIYQLSATNKNRVDLKLIKNGKTEILDSDWGSIEARIENGSWKPLIAPKTQPQKFQPTQTTLRTLNINDLIFNKQNDKLYQVIGISNQVVKLMTSNNLKETINIGDLFDEIDNFKKIKLAFSIFDTFVNPYGDLYKIMEVYPKNEKSLFVKVNENPNLEVFLWDLIEDWVKDGYWKKGTKADADQIKANLSQAMPNATQQKMAQVTATPTQTPKKRLTKLEKQIKDLQEIIDGLLFLADDDADAKAELEKKLIEIEALKSKKV
jgi:hypothetical protein